MTQSPAGRSPPKGVTVEMTPNSSPMLQVEARADVLLPLLLELDVMDVWSKINLRLLRYREHVRRHYRGSRQRPGCCRRRWIS